MLEKLLEFDKRITVRLNRYKNKLLTPIIKFFAFFGQEPFWFAIIAYFVFIWYDPTAFVILGGTFLAGLYIVVPLKYIVKRERPFQKIDEIIFLDVPQLSKSFPSWHSYNIISLSCATLYYSQNWLLFPILALFSLMVCYSRIYLGSHYFLDVICGIIFGFVGFTINILTTQLWLSLIYAIEGFYIYPVIHQYWVTVIFTQWWYLLLVISVYCVIFMNAYYSLVIKRKKKKSIESV